MNGEAEKFNEV